MKDQGFIKLFIDEEVQPIGEFPTPVTFELDTIKLTDGKHLLKVVSKDNKGREGIKLISFVVRNGPAIAVEGLKQDEVVEGVLPLMINAYGKGDQKTFLLHGSETPRSLPWWLVAGIILFIAWTGYFVMISMAIKV
jgi:hypothetical protein